MIKGEIFNIPGKKPRVLVAPLDWGLGHATRCIPVIFKLLEQNCEVIIAAETAVKFLLQKEFPDLIFIDLKGYRMQYSLNKFWMPVKMLLQFPKLILRVNAENRWLKKTVAQYKIDAVVSDNRLGLSHKKVHCVYITHQLQIKSGNRLSERIVRKIHYRFINKYNACWVPDTGDKINLAGELSHPARLPKTPVTYLGPLSRFQKKDVGIKYNLCIILSGPEPQRTVFEKILLNDLKKFTGRALLVRGLPGESSINVFDPYCHEIRNHLPAGELCLAIQQSEMIIGRCGYSTVMDLVKLQKRAVLVPTPGQTEQEYLAGYLQQQKLFYCPQQKEFSLQDVLKKAEDFQHLKMTFLQKNYEAVIEDFVTTLKKINNAGI